MFQTVCFAIFCLRDSNYFHKSLFRLVSSALCSVKDCSTKCGYCHTLFFPQFVSNSLFCKSLFQTVFFLTRCSHDSNCFHDSISAIVWSRTFVPQQCVLTTVCAAKSLFPDCLFLIVCSKTLLNPVNLRLLIHKRLFNYILFQQH